MKKDEERLVTGIRAGYSFFHIRTQEMEDTLEKIKKAILDNKAFQGDRKYNLIVWDYEQDPDPEVLLFETLEKAPARTVVVAKNFNWYFVDKEFGGFNKSFLTYFQNRLEVFPTTESRKVFIILSNDSFDAAIPEVLQRDFLNIEFDLPDTEEIKKTLDYVVNSAKENKDFKVPSEKETKRIIESGKGLTRRELENAFSYSVINDSGTIKACTVASIRAKDIEDTAGLKVLDTNEGFESLLGMDNLKDFYLTTYNNPLALGFLLVGPAGCGKTAFVKAAGKESGRLTLLLEMAQLGDKYVGGSEGKIKRVIDVITANAPVNLIIDEFEKGLAGASVGAGGGIKTSGSDVQQRAMAQFLKFLSDDRPPGVHITGTCNNIDIMDPAWIRAERWDCAPFYLGLPNDEMKEAILLHYSALFEVFGRPTNMEGWSGAEIKACCRIAKMMDVDVDKAERFIIPVSKTMDQEISRLELWAKTRCIPASTPINGGSKKLKRGKREIG